MNEINNNSNEELKEKVRKILETKESNEVFDKTDIQKNKVLSILCYIVPFVPYFFIKDSKWVKYHSIQGMNLLIVYIVYIIISSILTNTIKVSGNCSVGFFSDFGLSNGVPCMVTPWWIRVPLSLINVCFVIMVIIGILNVLKEKAKPLPIIEKINVFK